MLELLDWKDFSITSWYHLFHEDTLKSILIEIPQDLLKKLLSSSFEEDEEEAPEHESSSEWQTSIQNALNELDRNAFVKNNWRSPLDSKPFSFGNTLKVNNLEDILQYLSLSDRITRDFESSKGIPFCIVLRPWLNIHPASEFRCIVINKILRGISPRDWPTFYPHFKEDGPQIIEKIQTFFKNKVSKFPRSNFIFDIILTLPDEPVIVDFSPLNSKSNLLSFSWKEISPIINKNSTAEVAPVFRYLESDFGIMAKSYASMKFSKMDDNI